MVERSPRESTRYNILRSQLHILMSEHFFLSGPTRETADSVIEDMDRHWAGLVAADGEVLTREVIATKALVRGYTMLAPDRHAATCTAEAFTRGGSFTSYRERMEAGSSGTTEEEYHQMFYMDGIRISLGAERVEGLRQVEGGVATVYLPEDDLL